MYFARLSKTVLAVLLLAAGSGCAAETAVPTATSMPTEVPIGEAGAGLCANPLYPVVEGATWTYASSGASGYVEPYTFTDTISEVRPDGFTLTSEFADLTRTQEWSCRPEGLVALQLGSGPAGGVSTSQIRMDVTTDNVTGVTIPVTVSAGQSWSYSLDFEGELEIAGNSAEAVGTSKSEFSAAGIETVTVPAGTFDAMKILATTTIDVQATYQGLTVPVTFSAQTNAWFAPGVGWVKLESSGNLQGTEVTETINLESYSIP
jgi:hypothetical protein